LTSTEEITEKEILDTFKDAGVLEAFKKLSENEKKEMTGKITSLKSAEKQVKMMLKYIDQLSKKNDLKKTEIW
jgi:iron uptake system EfeUOB component EfeO/EfeM